MMTADSIVTFELINAAVCNKLNVYNNRFWTMPAFLLKRQVLVNLPTDNLEPEVAKSIDFMVDRVGLFCIIT